MHGTWATGRRWAGLLCLAWACLLGGCASAPRFTVDDGRPVDEQLLARIRAYGEGERAIRPAISRSSALADAECDKQFELPFSVATSESWDAADRVAWVRALGVDERLTVIATAPDSPLQAGERIAGIQGMPKDAAADQLSMKLVDLRDLGKPFKVTTDGGKEHEVRPFEVCRGYTRFAPPNTPTAQDYHWALTLHSLQVAQTPLTDDEALWVVLWTQGLSEEGGARMKAYHYTTSVVGTLYNLATLVSGVKAAALAADAAAKVAQQVAGDFLKQQAIGQLRQMAVQKLREGLIEAAVKLSQEEVVEFVRLASVNRLMLSGVARVGATVFDRADQWAFERMGKLNANPLAGFSLHQKLAERGFAANAFALDTDRLSPLTAMADSRGLAEQVVAILKGIRPADIEFALTGMPLATAPKTFSFSDPAAAEREGVFAFGLVEAMMTMPVASKGR